LKLIISSMYKENLEAEFFIYQEAQKEIDKLFSKFKEVELEEKLVLKVLLEVLIEKIYVVFDENERRVVGETWEKVIKRFLLKEGVNYEDESSEIVTLN
tara:strand:+ start:1266 stop:1562 length:297 start_codon:yes stop_codon:yes gene_type:complete